MKALRVLTIISFFILLLLPVLAFDFREDAVSEIDNRKLARSPFSEEAMASGDLTGNMEKYVEDRIGFRDKMILSYTVLNDRIFGKMVHPSYVYGKEEYVFGAGLNVYPCYSEYHEVFADMVLKMQEYCEERDIPFLFVFNPAKPAVLTEYIPAGMDYNREWVDLFLDALDRRGVHYVDNTELLRQKTKEGEVVFNKKYDANHWNDLGALYGTNQVLETLQKELPQIHVNKEEDLIFDEVRQTTLPVSEFPIDDMVPAISVKAVCEDITEEYRGELSFNESFSAFGYYRNPDCVKEGAPRALVFQGSYMNVYGYKYFMNGFGEYIYVHDYQNVIDFPYYFNIFQPECVVFEVAEYTIHNDCFNYDRMKAMDLSPTLESVLPEKEDLIQDVELNAEDLVVEKGKKLTRITWRVDSDVVYGWLKTGEEKVYDLMKNEAGNVTATILTEEYEQCMDTIQIILYDGNGWRRLMFL